MFKNRIISHDLEHAKSLHIHLAICLKIKRTIHEQANDPRCLRCQMILNIERDFRMRSGGLQTLFARLITLSERDADMTHMLT